MAKVLVYVSNNRDKVELYVENLRRGAHGISTEHTDNESGTKDFKFFEIDERDVDIAISTFTNQNAGQEVIIYRPFKSGIRPAGELVVKEISKDGVLPA